MTAENGAAGGPTEDSKPDVTVVYTVAGVIAWLERSASSDEQRQVAAVLAQKTALMRKVMPVKKTAKAPDKQVFARAMRLMSPDDVAVIH